jgi:biopolymer transport protein ExbB
VYEIIQAGGWLMLPILLCSIIALAIVLERLWVLRPGRVAPRRLVTQAWQWVKSGELDRAHIELLRNSSPLGRVLAAGLVNRRHSREVMKESVEDTGRHVTHDLERYLNALGTIAAITPLLGLLGTVIGLIDVFDVIGGSGGVRSPAELAPGLSKALITTVAGLVVAIPTLVFYRYFRGRVDELVITMEQEALKIVEMLHGERENDLP